MQKKNNDIVIFLPYLGENIDLHLWGQNNNTVSKKKHHAIFHSVNSAITFQIIRYLCSCRVLRLTIMIFVHVFPYTSTFLFDQLLEHTRS